MVRFIIFKPVSHKKILNDMCVFGWINALYVLLLPLSLYEKQITNLNLRKIVKLVNFFYQCFILKYCFRPIEVNSVSVSCIC